MFIDKVQYNIKPSDKEVIRIQVRKKAYRNSIKFESEYSLDEILGEIVKGKTIVYSNHFTKDTQYLVMDIDSIKGNVTTTKELKERLKEVGLPIPNLIYKSFSYSPEIPRYRVIWLLSERVDNAKYKLIYSFMVSKLGFSTIDKSCSTIEKLYYGAKKEESAAKVLHRIPLEVSKLNLGEVREYKDIEVKEFNGAIEKLVKGSNGARKILSGTYSYQECLSIIGALRVKGIEIGTECITDVVKLDDGYEEGERVRRESGMKQAWESSKVYVPAKGTVGMDLMRYINVFNKAKGIC